MLQGKGLEREGGKNVVVEGKDRHQQDRSIKKYQKQDTIDRKAVERLRHCFKLPDGASCDTRPAKETGTREA